MFITLQIKTMIQISETYKMLKISNIPGTRELHTELNNILSTFSNKRENVLNITMDIWFEDDNAKFHNEVETWKNRFKNHLTTEIEEESSFENKIELMRKCDELNIVDLELDHVYASTLRNLIACKKILF